jgi:hypothetical protein
MIGFSFTTAKPAKRYGVVAITVPSVTRRRRSAGRAAAKSGRPF